MPGLTFYEVMIGVLRYYGFELESNRRKGMDEFIFVTSNFNKLKGWFVRVSKLQSVMHLKDIDLTCCEFCSIPPLLQHYIQSNTESVIDYVEF